MGMKTGSPNYANRTPFEGSYGSAHQHFSSLSIRNECISWSKASRSLALTRLCRYHERWLRICVRCASATLRRKPAFHVNFLSDRSVILVRYRQHRRPGGQFFQAVLGQNLTEHSGIPPSSLRMIIPSKTAMRHTYSPASQPPLCRSITTHAALEDDLKDSLTGGLVQDRRPEPNTTQYAHACANTRLADVRA